MPTVFVSDKLQKDVTKRLSKKDADICFLEMYQLQSNPYKGDILTTVGNIILKELKHNGFRFYFIHSSKFLKLITKEELEAEIIKFIAMSAKGKEQQRVINTIKKNLKQFGFDFY